MKGNFKATSALALLSTTNVTTLQVKKFGETVAEEFRQIPLQERMNAARAILVGIGLHGMKVALKRGEFRDWMEANVTQGNIWTKSTAIKNASFFMRLAIAFVEQAKPSKQELLALTAGGAITPNLNNADSAAKKLFARIEDFIGERSLNEILIDEGIKGGGSGSGSGATAAITGGGEDPLLADTASHLMGLRALLLDPETVKRFTTRQLDDIEKQWASGLEQFRQIRAKMRG